ncbi:MAG: hypothetical protein ABR511_14375 [Acidimicrobiales bacterium]
MRAFGKLRRPTVALAVVTAAALSLAACGGSSKSSSGTSATTSGGSGAAKTAGPAAEYLTLKGISTAVDLDAGTLKTLTEKNVTVTPVDPAKVTTNGGVTTATFPITQGFVSVYPNTVADYIRGTFNHSGGLKFAAGGKTLEVTDFVVNPGDSTLTATVGGASAAQILDLDGTNVQISTDAQGDTKLDGTVAKLSQIGADALNKYFGVTFFAKGIVLGVVHVTATGTPGPKGAASAEYLTLKGANTAVDLDAGTMKVLAQKNVAVAPVAPATVTGSTASFPITQGYVAVYPTTEPDYVRGAFSHSGGLKFTAGGKSLELTDFFVNPGDSTLTATVTGGSQAQVLDLDGSNLAISTDASGNTKLDGTVAKLSQVGADALNKYFGVTFFAKGIVLGVVHVTANGTPAPKA